MHSMLRRQLKKAGFSEGEIARDVRLQKLCARMESAYAEWDRDRELLERSLMLASDEMRELYDTLREEASEAKRLADERNSMLSKAMDGANESIVITDPKGKIEYVNSAFTRITGFSAAEALGETTHMFESDDAPREVYAKLWQTILAGRPWHGSIIGRRKDGSTYPSMLSITPIVDDDGTITHFVGIQQDMSDYRELELQFQQAQKMEAIGTLVGGIAHDFNNMLAGISGQMYMAKKRLEKQRVTEAIEKIEAVETLTQRAASMIAQLLAFARKGVVQMHVLSITSFVKESLKLAMVSVPENIKVNYDITHDDLMITGDVTQLQQILMNLLNNARDALKGADDPRIALKLEAYQPDAEFRLRHPEVDAAAHLSISDNGCGIAAADLEQIFDPFFTTKEVGQGTGLGLSMVYGAMQSHHGAIEVESKPGEGTTFHLYFPLTETIEEYLEGGEAQSDRQAGGTILLADDEALVRRTTAEVLESMGYRVITAVDGVEAVTRFVAAQDAIDLVILDMVMPNCGGFQAARQIRTHHATVPVIFITGYDKAQLHEQGVVLENSQILSKPVNFERLNRMIQKVIS